MAKIERRDVRNLMQGINAVDALKDKCDQHFTYGIGKDRRIIRNEVEDLNEAETKKLEKYNKEVEKLNEKFAKKSEAGNVVIDARTAAVTLDFEKIYEYNKDLKKLDEKYKKDLDENKAFFKEEVDLPLYLISNKYFPDLECGIADFLFPIREDLDAEETKEKEDAEAKKKEEEPLKKEKK